MTISRREFLGFAAGAVATLLPGKPGVTLDQGGPSRSVEKGCLPLPAGPVSDCVLIDLRRSCALPESLAGYEAALRETGVHFVKVQGGLVPRSRSLIVPGLGFVPLGLAHNLSACLQAGARLVLESGAGFLDPADFAALQSSVQTHFGLVVRPPVDLWGRRVGEGSLSPRRGRAALPEEPDGLPYRKPGNPRRVPYVDFCWPVPTKVRDFTRVVPITAQAGEVIGWAEGLPIAMKRKVGRGRLIFLGSPLGPSLLAGDHEARRWLRALLSFG